MDLGALGCSLLVVFDLEQTGRFIVVTVELQLANFWSDLDLWNKRNPLQRFLVVFDGSCELAFLIEVVASRLKTHQRVQTAEAQNTSQRIQHNKG